MTEPVQQTTNEEYRKGYLAGLEAAAQTCEAMERTSPRRAYQEAAAWLAEAIREKVRA